MDGERLMVKDWDRVFFYKEAYSVRGEIQWGRWPACRRSLAYSRLAKTTAGHTAMWVFGTIVGMLHKRRSIDGLMVHENGQPFSVEDIRTMAELTTKQVVASIAMLRSTEIGWIRPEAEERNRRTKRDQPGDNRAATGAQPARSRATTGLEERRGEERRSMSLSSVNLSAQSHMLNAEKPCDATASPVRANARTRGDGKHRQFSKRVLAVWDACAWRKVGRRAALVAIERAGAILAAERFKGDRDAACAFLSERAAAYSASPLVQSTDRQYLPHPATWFHDGRYDDDPAEWAKERTQDQNNDGPTLEIAGMNP